MIISEYDRKIFAEQVKVSAKAIEDLKDDPTPEGKKEFYRHVAILKEIRARLEIADSSEKNLREIKNVLSNL